MEQKPCGLLRYTQSAVKFPRGNPVAVAGNQPHGREPFVQAEGRILHDGSGLQRELSPRMAVGALPAVVLRLERDLRSTASRAEHAIGPAPGNHVVPAISRTAKIDNRLL